MKNKLIRFSIIFGIGAAAFAVSFLPVDKATWWLRIGGILLCILGVATLFIREKKPVVSEEYRYAVKPHLMTAPEVELYYRLMGAVGRDMHVFPQIALAAFIDKTTCGSYRNELFRVVDFLLCDGRTTKPLLVVELNDASHKREDRRVRDEKVRCICERAGIKILTIELGEEMDERTLKKRIRSLI